MFSDIHLSCIHVCNISFKITKQLALKTEYTNKIEL